jgi:hypothetical protein
MKRMMIVAMLTVVWLGAAGVFVTAWPAGGQLGIPEALAVEPTPTPNMQATIAAAIAATLTGAPTATPDLAATIQAGVAATLAAALTPQPTATPDMAATIQAGVAATMAALAPQTPAAPPPPPPPPPTVSIPTVSAVPGMVLDFEGAGPEFRHGDEPYGELTRSTEQPISGAYSGKLTYNLPAVTNNYVVLLAHPAQPIPGPATGLTAWVYGNASGHYLNVWVQDSAGEVRQYTFGKITFQGLQPMTAWFDETKGWPNGHISGADKGGLVPPLWLTALVLDGVPDGQASSGTIYVDNIMAAQGPIPPVATPMLPLPPTPAPPPYLVILGNNRVYEPWGRPTDPDGCNGPYDDNSPMRRFTIEVVVTNYSSVPIPDGWLPTFISASGASLVSCQWYYVNTEVQTGETTDVTFATHVQTSDWVRAMQFNFPLGVVTICLNGAAQEVPCQ